MDPDGTTHVRLHRTYRGLDVVGGDLVVHQSKAGTWKGSSLTLDKNLSLAVTPSVTGATADAKALASAGDPQASRTSRSTAPPSSSTPPMPPPVWHGR